MWDRQHRTSVPWTVSPEPSRIRSRILRGRAGGKPAWRPSSRLMARSAHVVSTNRDVTARVLAEQPSRRSGDARPTDRAGQSHRIGGGTDSSARRKPTHAAMHGGAHDRPRSVQARERLARPPGRRPPPRGRRRATDRPGESGATSSPDPGETSSSSSCVTCKARSRRSPQHGGSWRPSVSPSFSPEGEYFATASIGVAHRPRIDQEPDDVLRDADAAMYAAKNSGRDRVAVFNEALRDAASERLALEGELRHALDRGRVHRLVPAGGRPRLAVGWLPSRRCCGGSTRMAGWIRQIASSRLRRRPDSSWASVRGSSARAAGKPPNGHDSPSLSSLMVRVNFSAVQLEEAGLLDTLDRRPRRVRRRSLPDLRGDHRDSPVARDRDGERESHGNPQAWHLALPSMTSGPDTPP